MCIFLKLCLLPIGQKHFQIVNQILGNPRRKNKQNTLLLFQFYKWFGERYRDIIFKRYYVEKSRKVIYLKTTLELLFLCIFLDAKKARQEAFFLQVFLMSNIQPWQKCLKAKLFRPKYWKLESHKKFLFSTEIQLLVSFTLCKDLCLSAQNLLSHYRYYSALDAQTKKENK